MAYDKSDPRSRLAGSTATQKTATGANVAPQYFEFDKMDTAEVSPLGSQTRWVRS